MLESTIIEVDGVFLGLAIRQDARSGLRFFAMHEAVSAMHGRLLADLEESSSQARRVFRSHQGSAPGPARRTH